MDQSSCPVFKNEGQSTHTQNTSFQAFPLQATRASPSPRPHHAHRPLPTIHLSLSPASPGNTTDAQKNTDIPSHLVQEFPQTPPLEKRKEKRQGVRVGRAAKGTNLLFDIHKELFTERAKTAEGVQSHPRQSHPDL